MSEEKSPCCGATIIWGWIGEYNGQSTDEIIAQAFEVCKECRQRVRDGYFTRPMGVITEGE